jgi:hypothetical protein
MHTVGTLDDRKDREIGYVLVDWKGCKDIFQQIGTTRSNVLNLAFFFMQVLARAANGAGRRGSIGGEAVADRWVQPSQVWLNSAIINEALHQVGS